MNGTGRASGSLYLREGKRGAAWYCKVRPNDGTPRRNLAIGPAWTEKGRPPEGHFTRRTAQAWLDALLVDLRRGIAPEGFRSSSSSSRTFADAAESWMTRAEAEQRWKPSTTRDRQSMLRVWLLPAFGDVPVRKLTARKFESWRAEAMASGRLRPRMAGKALRTAFPILEHARREGWLETNPLRDVQQIRDPHDSSRLEVYSAEEVAALLRAATSRQDATMACRSRRARASRRLAGRWRGCSGRLIGHARSRKRPRRSRSRRSAGRGRSAARCIGLCIGLSLALRPRLAASCHDGARLLERGHIGYRSRGKPRSHRRSRAEGPRLWPTPHPPRPAREAPP